MSNIVINISDVSLIYRDDVLFLFFVLKNKDKKSYKEFKKLEHNRKTRSKDIFKMYKSIKKYGQLVPIKIIEVEDILYPVSGSHRLASLLAIGEKKVKIRKYPISHSTEWNHKKIIDSHHFRFLPKIILDKFINFKNSL